ncbi:hypothetical protein OAU52_01270, partial [bacterium]|nr:hypothetical protein [bacterium]
MISKCVLASFFGLVGFVSVSAEVLTSVSGKTISIMNNTSSKQNIVGVRFDAITEFTGFGPWQNPIINKEDYNGVQVFEVQATQPWDLYPLNVAPDSVYQGEASGADWDATIEASKYLESLYSLGACNEVEEIKTADPLTLSELEGELNSPNYYDASHRYEKPDGLGTKGGVFSGGLFDSYVGETQMQFAIPTDSIPYVSSSILPWEDSKIATMTFMATVMGQELFGIDQQLIYSIGARESYLGNGFHTERNSNAMGVFSPWQIEDVTFTSRAMGYPKFYPYLPCLADPGARDVTSANILCGWDDYDDFALDYMDESGITPLNHPKIVNAWMGAAMTLWFNYDLLFLSTDLGFRNVLAYSSDSLAGLCGIIPLYQMGINSGVEKVLDSANKD